MIKLILILYTLYINLTKCSMNSSTYGIPTVYPDDNLDKIEHFAYDQLNETALISDNGFHGNSIGTYDSTALISNTVLHNGTFTHNCQQNAALTSEAESSDIFTNNAQSGSTFTHGCQQNAVNVSEVEYIDMHSNNTQDNNTLIQFQDVNDEYTKLYHSNTSHHNEKSQIVKKDAQCSNQVYNYVDCETTYYNPLYTNRLEPMQGEINEGEKVENFVSDLKSNIVKPVHNSSMNNTQSHTNEMFNSNKGLDQNETHQTTVPTNATNREQNSQNENGVYQTYRSFLYTDKNPFEAKCLNVQNSDISDTNFEVDNRSIHGLEHQIAIYNADTGINLLKQNIERHVSIDSLLKSTSEKYLQSNATAVAMIQMEENATSRGIIRKGITDEYINPEYTPKKRSNLVGLAAQSETCVQSFASHTHLQQAGTSKTENQHCHEFIGTNPDSANISHENYKRLEPPYRNSGHDNALAKCSIKYGFGNSFNQLVSVNHDQLHQSNVRQGDTERQVDSIKYIPSTHMDNPFLYVNEETKKHANIAALTSTNVDTTKLIDIIGYIKIQTKGATIKNSNTDSIVSISYFNINIINQILIHRFDSVSTIRNASKWDFTASVNKASLEAFSENVEFRSTFKFESKLESFVKSSIYHVITDILENKIKFGEKVVHKKYYEFLMIGLCVNIYKSKFYSALESKYFLYEIDTHLKYKCYEYNTHLLTKYKKSSPGTLEENLTKYEFFILHYLNPIFCNKIDLKEKKFTDELGAFVTASHYSKKNRTTLSIVCQNEWNIKSCAFLFRSYLEKYKVLHHYNLNLEVYYDNCIDSSFIAIHLSIQLLNYKIQLLGNKSYKESENFSMVTYIQEFFGSISINNNFIMHDCVIMLKFIVPEIECLFDYIIRNLDSTIFIDDNKFLKIETLMSSTINLIDELNNSLNCKSRVFDISNLCSYDSLNIKCANYMKALIEVALIIDPKDIVIKIYSHMFRAYHKPNNFSCNEIGDEIYYIQLLFNAEKQVLLNFINQYYPKGFVDSSDTEIKRNYEFFMQYIYPSYKAVNIIKTDMIMILRTKLQFLWLNDDQIDFFCAIGIKDQHNGFNFYKYTDIQDFLTKPHHFEMYYEYIYKKTLMFELYSTFKDCHIYKVQRTPKKIN